MRAEESYEARVARSLADLGIPASYAEDRRLPLQAEAAELVSVGFDIHGRERQLAPEAARRWEELLSAALRDGITLQLVSAFRTLEYQQRIFERKLAAGQSLEQILIVNAPPGYSEHHTGRAVDLTTPGCPPLEEEFETTPAFGWLERNGPRLGFTMSYPRGNPFGVIYEPWHWAVRPEARAPRRVLGAGDAINMMEESDAVTVRRARSGDLPAVMACLAVTFEPYREEYTPGAFGDTVPTGADAERRFQEMTVLVAEAGPRGIVGTIAHRVEAPGQGHLRGMAVVPEFQGRGVAGQLLHAAEEELRERGCSRVTLNTTRALRRAIGFYLREGYRPTGSVTDFFGMELFEYEKRW